MTAPTITPLPDAPQRANEPATFVTKADAWVAAMTPLTEEINAFGEYLNGYVPAGGYGPGGTDVPVADGGTGASTAGDARTNLGVNTRTIVLSLTGTALTASEVLAAIMPPTGETWTFPANLSTSAGKKLSGGVNPVSTYTIDLKKNGSSVATISISTSGVVSFVTSGGTSFSLAGGSDEMQAIGNATPDAAVGYVFTLAATWA